MSEKISCVSRETIFQFFFSFFLKKIQFVCLLVFVFWGVGFSALYGEDTNQFLGDQLSEEEGPLQSDDNGKDDSSAFIPGEIEGPLIEPQIPGEAFDHPPMETELPEVDSKITTRDKILTQDGHILGEYENNENYVDSAPQSEKNFKEFKKEGNSNYSFLISKDTFQYKSANNSFNKIFRDANDSKFPATLRIGNYRFFTQGLLGGLGWGLNIGLGYNSGKGIFLDGTKSNSNFILWTIPLDVPLVYETPLFSIFKLSVAGGPSILGMIQNRSDKEEGNEKKNRRQYSWGYFAEVLAKFNLSSLFSANPYTLLNQYSVTSVFLTLSMRNQNYFNFKSKDISVTGTSYALGLTYEIF